MIHSRGLTRVDHSNHHICSGFFLSWFGSSRSSFSSLLDLAHRTLQDPQTRGSSRSVSFECSCSCQQLFKRRLRNCMISKMDIQNVAQRRMGCEPQLLEFLHLEVGLKTPPNRRRRSIFCRQVRSPSWHPSLMEILENCTNTMCNQTPTLNL